MFASVLFSSSVWYPPKGRENNKDRMEKCGGGYLSRKENLGPTVQSLIFGEYDAYETLVDIRHHDSVSHSANPR